MASFFKTSSLKGTPSPSSTSNLSSRDLGGALGAAPSGRPSREPLDAAGGSSGDSASATSV